jgi:hypothetical protein
MATGTSNCNGRPTEITNIKTVTIIYRIYFYFTQYFTICREQKIIIFFIPRIIPAAPWESAARGRRTAQPPPPP